MSAKKNLDGNLRFLSALIREGGSIDAQSAGGKDLLLVLEGPERPRLLEFSGSGHGMTFEVALNRAVKSFADDVRAVRDTHTLYDIEGSLGSALAPLVSMSLVSFRLSDGAIL